MTHDTEALTERLAAAIRAAGPRNGQTMNEARALAALASIPGSGWRLVPEVATEEMVKSGSVAWTRYNGCEEPYDSEIPAIYTAMLNAAPAIGEVK